MLRLVLPLLLAATAIAQQMRVTDESYRGVSAVSRQVAWASGTHGTYLRTTDGGANWAIAQVPDASALDFRAVVAFSVDEAFLMSSGTGDQSRIYHTADGGMHWQLQFKNSNPKGFFDSMAFWDSQHGIVVGDPVTDETGKLKFEVLITTDGKNWNAIPPAQLPLAIEGEGAFAASNTCVAVRDANIWFATGGAAARVFHSPDRGQNWKVADTPIVHGPDSAGIFSIAFRDATHGVIAGGDYKHPDQDGPNLAFTSDGGKTWALSKIHPQAFFSAVTYDRNAGAQERLFVVGSDFVFDFRPPANPLRISPGRKADAKFNAVSAYPSGGALIVGPRGSIAIIQ